MNIIEVLLWTCVVAGCVAATVFLLYCWISSGCPAPTYNPDEWQEAKRIVDYMDFCQEVEEKYRERNDIPFDPEAHKSYRELRHYYMAKMDHYGGGRT